MEETLKMMKSILEGCKITKSIEELISEYKQTQNTDILAYLFVKYYLMITKLSHKYLLLDTQDIASYSLQELDNAIMKFDLDRQCSFVTFFYCILDNRLKMEINKLRTKASVANYLLQDLPEYEEIVDDKFTFNSLNDYGFTSEQNKICNYILSGYSCREIASMLDVSHTTIYNKLKNIGKILVS